MTTATRAPARARMLRDLLVWLNERFAPDGPPIVASAKERGACVADDGINTITDGH